MPVMPPLTWNFLLKVGHIAEEEMPCSRSIPTISGHTTAHIPLSSRVSSEPVKFITVGFFATVLNPKTTSLYAPFLDAGTSQKPRLAMGAGTEASREPLYTCGSPSGSDDFDKEGPADYESSKKDFPAHRITESVAGKGMLVVDGNLQRTGIRFRSQVLCRMRPLALVWIVLALGVVGVLVPFSSLLPRAGRPGVVTSTDSLTAGGGHSRSHHLLSPLGWGFGSRAKKSGGRPGPPHQLPSADPNARCTPPDSTHEHFFLFGKPFDLAHINATAVTRDRGIVMAASGLERMSVGAYVTCYVVRRVLGSKMPIEVFYVGEKEALPEHTVNKLKELGDVEVIDLVTALDERYGSYYRERGPAMAGKLAYLSPSEEQLRSYAAKPYAVLASSFRENLLFDAGAVPFQMPDTFFDLESYRASGFTIFRDYVPSSKVSHEGCVCMLDF